MLPRPGEQTATLDTMAGGARSEEAHLWFSSVCEAVQEIPAGKVTSYAHIAKLVGKRKHHRVESMATSLTRLRHQLSVQGKVHCSARGGRHVLSMTSGRQVGVCLKHLPAASTGASGKPPKWHDGNVPWQRVINAKGGISPRSV